MTFQFKNISAQLERIQAQLETRVNTIPFLQNAINKIRRFQAGGILADTLGKSKKHVVLLVTDFPRDVKSVKPYLETQRKNFESLGRDLKTKVSAQRSLVKSQIKSKRSRSGKNGKVASSKK